MDSRPIHIMFEITPFCNNNCLYCYNVWKGNSQYPKGQMSLEDIKRLFNPLISFLDLRSITLTGGEPTLHKDLIEIISFFKENHIRISLATNGTLIDSVMAEKLSKAKLDSVEIPLLASNKLLHNELTCSNSFDDVIQAVGNTVEKGIPTAVVFVATKKNFKEAVSVLDLAVGLKANMLLFDRFIPGGRGLQFKNELLLTSDEVFQAVNEIAQEIEINKYRIYFSIGIPLNSSKTKIVSKINCAPCSGAEEKFTIDFLGNLRICEQHPLILGNLFKNDFYELINKDEVNLFKKFEPQECGCKVEAWN